MSEGANAHLLPDSRLKSNPTLGSQMVDWPLPGGGTVRLEAALIFCVNCGKEYGYVPKENTTFAFYLCGPCHQKFGDTAGTFAVPDDEFCKAVVAEMESRFGRALTAAEIIQKLQAHELGRPLELLLNESPFPSADRRPQG